MASELWNIKTWAISPLDICLLCVCPALCGNLVMLFKRKQYPRALTGIALEPEAGSGAGDGVRLARVRPVPPIATSLLGNSFRPSQQAHPAAVGKPGSRCRESSWSLQVPRAPPGPSSHWRPTGVTWQWGQRLQAAHLPGLMFCFRL